MKYILTKKITTGAGYTYAVYLQALATEGGVSLSVMKREEAKVYTSRKEALKDRRTAGKEWTIEPM